MSDEKHYEKHVERDDMPTTSTNRMVVTTTGAYSLDYEAAYAARKYDQTSRFSRFDEETSTLSKPPRDLSRDELLQNC